MAPTCDYINGCQDFAMFLLYFEDWLFVVCCADMFRHGRWNDLMSSWPFTPGNYSTKYDIYSENIINFIWTFEMLQTWRRVLGSHSWPSSRREREGKQTAVGSQTQLLSAVSSQTQLLSAVSSRTQRLLADSDCFFRFISCRQLFSSCRQR